MTFPGADTIKGGIIGDDCFLFNLFCFLPEPLTVVSAISTVRPSTALLPFVWGGISSDGERELSEGVSIWSEVVLDDGEGNLLVLIVLPPNVLLVRLVIAQCAYPG